MRDDEKKISELRDALKVDPASEACVELARILIEEPERRAEAREVLFTGLSRNAHLSQARLLLARAFYLDDMLEFSVRELVQLRKYSKVPSLQKLLDAFGSFAMDYLPGTASESQAATADNSSSPEESQSSQDSSDEDEDEGEVLAEIDIDDDFLEALDELSGE